MFSVEYVRTIGKKLSGCGVDERTGDEMIVLVFPSRAEFEVFKRDCENSRRRLLSLTV